MQCLRQGPVSLLEWRPSADAIPFMLQVLFVDLCPSAPPAPLPPLPLSTLPLQSTLPTLLSAPLCPSPPPAPLRQGPENCSAISVYFSQGTYVYCLRGGGATSAAGSAATMELAAPQDGVSMDRPCLGTYVWAGG